MSVATASFVTGSNVYGPNGANSVLTASFAQTASLALGIVGVSSFASSSYPFNVTGSTIYSWNSNVSQSSKLNVTTNNSFIVGLRAGIDASYDSPGFTSNNADSIIVGYEAAISSITSSDNTIIGRGAGQYLSGVSHSLFIGSGSGYESSADNSVFIGRNSGYQSFNANHSIFIGRFSGYQSFNASYSTFIGFQAGRNNTGQGPGDNNIIIGTNISLPNNTANSINIGGVLFASGTYSTKTGNPITTALATGRIGVNIYPTKYNFEVNGTANISNGLYVTNSINLTGSNNHIGNYIITGSINSTGSNTFTGNTIITGSLLTSGSNVFSGLQTVSGSLNVMENLTVFGSASFYVFSTTFITTSTIVATGSNTFGDTVDDIQTLIGYANISGSLTVTGSTFLTASNVAGGQNNYIARWNSNDSLTTGSLYETGSNILIGTTTNPNTNFKLYV
ncbi:MAG: beta strand repeat-containing protein, partial [Terrimicrobiaceae bacterium]